MRWPTLYDLVNDRKTVRDTTRIFIGKSRQGLTWDSPGILNRLSVSLESVAVDRDRDRIHVVFLKEQK